MKILTLVMLLFALCLAAQSDAATYKGIAVDQKSGKPVEGLRILCRQFVVDHGLGNRVRAKVLGYDFADVDTSIMDAVVTGADGAFVLTAGDGIPMRSVSVIKNGEYGVYNHSVPLARKMVIEIQDQPLRSDESKTDVYHAIPDEADPGLVIFATYGIGNGYVFCLDSRTGEVIWKDRIFWEATTPVLTKNGRAFVGTDGGFIFAYDIKTGQRIWDCQTRQEVGAFQLDDRSIYVGGGGNREVLMVIDQATGEVRKTIDTDRTITGLSLQSGQLVVSGERNLAILRLPALRTASSREERFSSVPLVSSTSILAVVQGPGDTLISYDQKKLSPVWQQTFQGGAAGTPILIGDSVVLPTGKGRRILHALDLQTGLSRWTYEMDVGLSYSDVLADPEHVYVRTAQDTIRCLDLDGRFLWETDVGHPMEPMELAVGQHRLFAIGRSALSCLDANTGRPIWVYSSHDPYARGTPVITTDGVFLAEEIGHVARVNRETGEAVWRFRCHGRIRTPVSHLKNR